MPEGDTVWNTARALHRALAGDRLTATDFRVPQLATADLTGATVLESAARGKHLLLRLRVPNSDGLRAQDGDRLRAQDGDVQRVPDGDGLLTLHSHLRMDGAWRAYAPGERWAARPAHTIRVVLRTADAVAVGYHLHDLALIPTAEEPSLVGHLGPDLLGPDWDPTEAVRRLAAQPARSIAEALLDQTNLAGIGNLYKSELLFLRGVSPWTPVREVPDLPGMVALAHRLLMANRGRWTQSTTGSLHRGRTSYVYGRRSEPCRRCGSTIRKQDQGERVTYWCPVCQPEPGRRLPAGPGRPTH
ncbi:Fpg/Nei family DNA glycosylase [Plantactinospora endophytica]|uniref:DNA-(apurinic or apyrimidinic site) lyase n=1 Tax=Plantactinospora endophytica TaxID=673535 RepID=A0ABQ4DX85_9ACTN|nr:Fpg/Nei family DNA glycosylase [Plantactinospora endophytica]GIG86702.1 putative endonuclease 8 2 [Plantactinospora endophytica]